jgi:hypothetical protein
MSIFFLLESILESKSLPNDLARARAQRNLRFVETSFLRREHEARTNEQTEQQRIISPFEPFKLKHILYRKLDSFKESMDRKLDDILAAIKKSCCNSDDGDEV